jgi:hypothetical protein
MNEINQIDWATLAVEPLDEGLPSPFVMTGVWFWLPMWEDLGQPQSYPSHHLNPLRTWPAWLDEDDDDNE